MGPPATGDVVYLYVNVNLAPTLNGGGPDRRNPPVDPGINVAHTSHGGDREARPGEVGVDHLQSEDTDICLARRRGGFWAHPRSR